MNEKGARDAAAQTAGASSAPCPIESCPIESGDAASCQVKSGSGGAGAEGLGVAEWVRALIAAPVGVLSRAAVIDELAALERLKNVAAARQARLAVILDVKERAAQAAAGVPASRRGQGVAAQLGLARSESPVRAAGLLSRAQILAVDLPAMIELNGSSRTTELAFRRWPADPSMWRGTRSA